MIGTLRNLLASRKFVILLVGVIVQIGGKLGFDLDSGTLISLAALFAIAIGAVAHEDAAAKSNNVLAPFDGPDDPDDVP